MSNQYFENNEQLESNRKEITYYYRGKTIKLITDNGVFSKGGVDFGSSLMLKQIDPIGKKKILDVGCGYGVIGISLALTEPSAFVTMVDVNERAMNLARLNALNNGANNTFVKESFAYQNIDDTYDLIVTNPPIRAGKKVVFEILEGSFEHLEVGGELFVVIQKKQGAESAVKKLKTLYTVVDKITQDKGYWILKCKK